MRRLALTVAITAAAATLAGCNKTDRDNIRNAAGNAAQATGNGLSKAASATENFATKAGGAISNGARETYRSFNDDHPAADTNTAGSNPDGKKPGN